MGVALSILGNNTSSLVGVAISASLLPPAVNAGICWAYAILLRCGALDNFNVDANGDPYNFNFMAGTSFALTMLNIICIWVFAILMFYVKEVAPTRSKTAFWSQDIKVARAVQKGSKSSMNLEAIKSGLQDAIMKERHETKLQKKPRHRFMGVDIDDDLSEHPTTNDTSTLLYNRKEMPRRQVLDRDEYDSANDAPSTRVRRRR